MHADPRRRFLLELYAAGCEAVDGRRRVRAALAGPVAAPPASVAAAPAGSVAEPPRGAVAGSPAGTVTAADPRADSWWLLAIGKAASAMTLGALDALGGAVERGLVVTRADHFDAELDGWPQLRRHAGDHPVPGPASLAAGEAVLEFAAAAAAGQQVLVLVSGGASSLVEAPLPGVTLEDLQRLNEWALGSGLDIAAVNALRQRCSRLKAGGLAQALAHCRARALVISDVAGDDPAVIGSGLVQQPATPPSPTPPRRDREQSSLPGWLTELLGRAGPPPPRASLPVERVGTLDDALAAVERAARQQGCAVKRLPGRATGDAEKAGIGFAHELALAAEEVVVWGGETTVTLPPQPGRGGRNQHLALACARSIAGHGDLVVLAAGTDGTDGNSADAGALVDGGTLQRGQLAEGDLDAALAAADAGTFLERAGDLLYTGPTGTNVGDLLIGLRRASAVDDEVDEGDGDAAATAGRAGRGPRGPAAPGARGGPGDAAQDG